jgi:anti-sigma B factor antagonist
MHFSGKKFQIACAILPNLQIPNKMIVQSGMENDGTVVLTVVVNSLDRMNAAEFRETAAQAIAASAGPVVVDCAQLEFIDSSGLGAFLHTHNLLPEARRPVRLIGVGMKVLTILELMQVHRIFDLEARK